MKGRLCVRDIAAGAMRLRSLGSSTSEGGPCELVDGAKRGGFLERLLMFAGISLNKYDNDVLPDSLSEATQILGVASLQVYPLSNVQVAEHPSPDSTFPSSHASAESLVPSPALISVFGDSPRPYPMTSKRSHEGGASPRVEAELLSSNVLPGLHL